MRYKSLTEVLHEALGREGTVEGDEAVVADDAGDREAFLGDGLSEECRRMILELDAALHFAGASDDDTLGEPSMSRSTSWSTPRWASTATRLVA